MNKWYQGIVVEHKELDNKMYHCFDDENFEKITNERNEQLKEIERLNNIINELEGYIKQKMEKCYEEGTTIGGFNNIWDIDKKLKELKGEE